MSHVSFPINFRTRKQTCLVRALALARRKARSLPGLLAGSGPRCGAPSWVGIQPFVEFHSTSGLKIQAGIRLPLSFVVSGSIIAAEIRTLRRTPLGTAVSAFLWLNEWVSEPHLTADHSRNIANLLLS